jgi:putative oxidoreductase
MIPAHLYLSQPGQAITWAYDLATCCSTAVTDGGFIMATQAHAIGLNVIGRADREQIGKLALRIALGVLILFHGITKLSGGIGFIADVVAKAGLPAFIAYGVYIGEVIAPLMVISGWYSRVGAGLIAINMLFAIGLVHAAEIFSLSQSGGWALELQGLFLFAAIAIALMGPGRYSVNSR